jgi:hypothetical protein
VPETFSRGLRTLTTLLLPSVLTFMFRSLPNNGSTTSWNLAGIPLKVAHIRKHFSRPNIVS